MQSVNRAMPLAVLGLMSPEALAYIGPGLGAGTLGVVLGLLGSVLLALVAFFWYPIKRTLFGGAKQVQEVPEDVEQPAVNRVEPVKNDADEP